MSSPCQYDAYYYEHGCGVPYQRNEKWLTFFQGIADRIIQDIHPVTVLDAGCAMGFLVEKLRERGVEAYGIDISEFAIASIHESIRPYCRIGSISDPLPQKYDLIVTIEVLEHIPKQEAGKAIENLCRYTDDILFSSTPFDFQEITHQNVQPPEYWAEQFARYGFYKDVDFDAAFLTAWAMRFRRSSEPFHRIVSEYERVIHRISQENSALRNFNVEQKDLLAKQEQQMAEKEQQVIELGNKLEAITSEWTFRAAQKIRSFAPIGSRREKFIKRILKAFRIDKT